MRILVCNKYFKKQGASTKYFFGLCNKFEEAGHEVIPFSMNDPLNEQSRYSNYFVPYVDFNKKVNVFSYAKEYLRSIHYVKAVKNVEKLVIDTKPDIVMLFNIYHHISPSVLKVFKKYSIPVVQLLEDYFLICPSYRLYAKHDVCESCKNKKYYNVVRRKCFRDSSFRSFAAASVAYIHEYLNSYKGYISYYIAPSEFVRTKFIEFGFEKKKIDVIPHALPLQGIEPSYVYKDYILYIGILEEWKGVSTLIESMHLLKNKGIKLIILGDGKQKMELINKVKELGLSDIVQFPGYLIGSAFKDLVKSSRFIIVPSEWYEVFGTVIWEAFAYGKPVIGANIGAIPELVKENNTGLLFEPQNEKELSSKIELLYNNENLLQEMGKKARSLVETKLNMDENYNRTFGLFDKILNYKNN